LPSKPCLGDGGPRQQASPNPRSDTRRFPRELASVVPAGTGVTSKGGLARLPVPGWPSRPMPDSAGVGVLPVGVPLSVPRYPVRGVRPAATREVVGRTLRGWGSLALRVLLATLGVGRHETPGGRWCAPRELGTHSHADERTGPGGSGSQESPMWGPDGYVGHSGFQLKPGVCVGGPSGPSGPGGAVPLALASRAVCSHPGVESVPIRPRP
jgi:hypothetical protein